jgi:hypothetical protein
VRLLVVLALVAVGSFVGPGRAVLEDVEGLIPRDGCRLVEERVGDDDAVAAFRQWRRGDEPCSRVQEKCARGLPWETALYHDDMCS